MKKALIILTFYEISWNDAKPIFSEYISSVIGDLFTSS